MTRTPMSAKPLVARPDAASVNELIRRWQQSGDRDARDGVVGAFLPLARRLAARYASPHEPIQDLVQVASLGLLCAIDRFDLERGTPFVAFAIPTILGELRRYFRNAGWSVHVPRGAQEMAMRVDRASREITAETGRAPRVAAIAEYLEVSVEEVVVGLDAAAAHYAASLDGAARCAEPGEPQTLADVLGAGDDGFALVDTKLSLSAAIRRLPFQQRRALSLRIEGNMRQAEIARLMGCSQMQISRLLRDATCSLRALLDPEPPGRDRTSSTALKQHAGHRTNNQ